MRISVKGRNLPVSDELREHVTRRFDKVARQVSELAELEVEVFEERNPAIADSQVAEATLHLKGVTLRARDASPDMIHSINLVSDEVAKQVKRHREKRRRRREARAAATAEAAGGVAEIPVLPDESGLGQPVVEGVLLEPAPERPADAA
jgi:putative sigma-54 modulation protein